jgi:hypothetical protein
MKARIRSFQSRQSHRALLASAFLLTALAGPATIESVQAKEGGGIAQPFILDPNRKNTVRVDVMTVPKGFGFGGKNEAIRVINSSSEGAGGCLLKDLKVPTARSAFKDLEMKFKAPKSPQDVRIAVCIEVPYPKHELALEVELSALTPRSLKQGWSKVVIDAGRDFKLNPALKGIVKRVRMSLNGRGNIYFGGTKITYSDGNVHPTDLDKRTATSHHVCKEGQD